MNALHMRRCAAAAAIVCAAVPVMAQSATASAPTNGCPAGYDLMSVSALAVQGYRVPGAVDDPTSGIRSFGRLGNSDGWVCEVPIGIHT